MSLLVSYASSDDEDDSQSVKETATVLAQNGHSTVEEQVHGPVAGPNIPLEVLAQEDTTIAEQYDLSPNSVNRAQIQALTMPRYPNFAIPSSPPAPARNSEAAAELTVRTRKFERFLELKKQGIHFNDRLASTAALRNPELLQKLADFAGIEPEQQYENRLGKEFGVPMKWPDGFLEGLIATNEKRRRKEKEGRSKLDFVSATPKARKI